MADFIFPHIKKSLQDFVSDEEGNIPRNKILTVGSMMLILAMILTDPAYAKHTSHRSHKSHKSHSSGGHRSHYSHYSSSGGHGNSTHSNHSSHSNHSNHSSHASHSNHSNHASHSNAAPALSTLNAIKAPGAGDNVDVGAVAGLVGAMESPPAMTTPVPLSHAAIEQAGPASQDTSATNSSDNG